MRQHDSDGELGADTDTRTGHHRVVVRRRGRGRNGRMVVSTF
jgi:hypothetical protein